MLFLVMPAITFLNSTFKFEFCRNVRPRELTVNVLNDSKEKVNTTVDEFMISSSDGKVSKVASAYTAEGVTGNMQVVDWSKHKHNWVRLKFAQVRPRPIVDLLISVDQADLLYSLKMFGDELVNQKLDFLPWGGPAVVTRRCQQRELR